MVRKKVKTNLSLYETIEDVLKEVDYKNNTYLKNLNNKTMKKNDFIKSQIQFYFAVTFFSRPMGVLAAKIPTPELRKEIVRNFWEEHGEGNLNDIHQNTFIELINRLDKNITREEIQETHLSPAIRIFNTVLIGTSTLEDYRIGVAMMGIIEYMFSDISGMIGRGILSNEWLKEDEMIHYDVHEVLDIRHSKDFFDVIEKDWNENEHNKYLIKQGLELGANIFNNLYKENIGIKI
jgi:pyrroloquinoline-quinone synthase